MKITSAEYVISAVNKKGFPVHDNPEFVFLGRSNVGKSSFINALTNRKNLAYTSSKPGKTITINFYHINKEFMLVDVPGYGYAQREKTLRMQFEAMLEDYLPQRQQIKIAFLIVDSRHQPSDDDIMMYNYLNYYQIPVIIIATKIDKIGKTKVYQHLKVIKETFKIDKDTIIPFSAETKYGVDEVLKIINDNLS